MKTRSLILLVAWWATACHKDDPAPDDDLVEDTDAVVVGHVGPKAGDGAVAGGPAKAPGAVVFPGVGVMGAGIVAAPTTPEQGEVAPLPSTPRPAPNVPTTGTYTRFFVTVSPAGTVGLAGEAVVLPGTYTPQPFPVGTLLVVASNGTTDLSVASFVDGRTAHAMQSAPGEVHGEVDNGPITLPVSVPSGVTDLAVWQLDRATVRYGTALTLANVPALTADATLLGSVEYKP